MSAISRRSLQDQYPMDHIPIEPPEVWGGVEPTVNRVGDTYLDQLARSGHDTRIDDLDRFAELGISAIRYPVLWEKIAPHGIENADWTWPDARLERLQHLGIRVIVGLVHHGSGPPNTSLVDPDFPEKLAEYARAVAQRYPWIQEYTPVNEPLTTARFSALYGHWYPHDQDDRSFARALINQCRAVVLSMQAIRETNPAARLVQTEDIGIVHAAQHLAYQAAFENERRWITFDLLTGKLTPDRRMWGWLQESGIEGRELEWFGEQPCPPNVLGVNYYLTSERFLDTKVDIYPGESVGTNGVDTYADVAAVRALDEPIMGVGPILQQVWDRYSLPIAITEVHNGSTREEQLRWLHEVWQHAIQAREGGIDLLSVTVWALLGSYDWTSLVTQDNGEYESGVFDVRGSVIRPTALAHMVRHLATSGAYDHPVLDVPGWWRRPDRKIGWTPTAPTVSVTTNARSILVVAGEPAFTSDLIGICAARHIPAIIKQSTDLDQSSDQITSGDIWAVILASRDSGDIRNSAYQRTSGQGIPFVSFTFAPEVRDMDELIEGGLVIVLDELDSNIGTAIHAALDLLIDGEEGLWCVSPSGDGYVPAMREYGKNHHQRTTVDA